MPNFELEPVAYGEPLLSAERRTERLREIVGAAEVAAEAAGQKLDRRDHRGLAARFDASEEAIGPVAAAAVAGWMRRNVLILPKTGGLAPFSVNRIQFDLLRSFCRDLEAGKPLRYVVLKARQFGISTLAVAWIYFLAHRLPSRGAAFVCHKDDATQNMRAMLDRAIEHGRNSLRIGASNGSEIYFARPVDVRLSFATAEAGEVKRSYTLHWLHASEVAFWTKATRVDLGLMQAVPNVPETFILKESTANGVGNLFWRQYWDAKEQRSDYTAKFYPWFLHEEYRTPLDAAERAAVMGSLDEEERRLAASHGVQPEQLAWRRKCVANNCDGDVNLFHQEYPSSDREAFLVSGRPVFDMALVEARATAAKAAPPGIAGFLEYDAEDLGGPPNGDAP